MNIFDINKLLKKDDIKIKYRYIQKYLTLKATLSNVETINIINIDYNLKKLIHHTNNVEYLIFADIKINGGIGDNMDMLLSDMDLREEQQSVLYNKLFDMVIVNKKIDNPLCNCCLTDYNPYDKSTWYTSSSTHKEVYKYNKDGISHNFISSNYLHICNRCNDLLRIKIKRYNDTLKLIPFTDVEFKKQTISFMKYEPLLFNLLFNYDIDGVKEILKHTKII